jgi:Nitrile hydratase, alpha chain
MSQQNPMQDQIIAKAMKEETFRQALLSNPKTVIERALGISVPQGVTIAVHQDTPTTLHLVLPAQVQTATELSDAELEQATGGFWCELRSLGACSGWGGILYSN